MRTKKSKIPKSAKTRLSDLTPEQDARGGRLPESPYPDGGPEPNIAGDVRSLAYQRKRRFITS